MQRSGNGAVKYNGIASLLVNGSAGVDTFSIPSTASGVSTSIDTGAGNDVINLGSGGNTLSNIAGTLSIAGGANDATPTNSSNAGSQLNVIVFNMPVGDKLEVFDGSGPVGSAYNVGATSIGRTGIPAISYSGIETVDVFPATGAADFNVTDTAAGTQVGIGGTSITGQLTVLNTGANSRLFTNPLSGNITASIATTGDGSILSLATTGGADTITIQGSGAGSGISVNTGAGMDHIIIQNTGVGSSISASGGDGADNLDLYAAAAGSAITLAGGNDADVVTVGGPAQTLSNILGDVLISSGSGSAGIQTVSTTINGVVYSQDFAVGDTVIFNDQGLSGNASYLIQPTTFQRAGTANFQLFDNETMIVNTGSGTNQIDVSGSPPNAFLTVHGNSGSDQVTLENFSGGLVLDLAGGNDTLDSTGTFSGKWLEVFGGAGDDILKLPFGPGSIASLKSKVERTTIHCCWAT